MGRVVQMGFGVSRRGFTLVELIAVMVVLGILAGVAAPRFFSKTDEAKEAAAMGARAALVQAVLNWRMNDAVVNGGEGEWPPDLDEVLQMEGGTHLLNPYHLPRFNQVYNIDRGGPNKMYMINKTIESASNSWGSIWYNPDNGRLMFRVPQQSTNDETIELFNRVNQTNITSLSQTN